LILLDSKSTKIVGERLGQRDDGDDECGIASSDEETLELDLEREIPQSKHVRDSEQVVVSTYKYLKP
jgi:hypothetical protein